MSAPFVVGQVLPSHTIHMSDERVVRYADASGDHNPIHLDDAAAVSAGLPGRIVHGMLTMGMFGTAATGWAGGVTNISAVTCRFRAVVMVGDTVTISGVVANVDAGLVTVEVRIVNQRDEPVLTNAVVEFAHASAS